MRAAARERPRPLALPERKRKSNDAGAESQFCRVRIPVLQSAASVVGQVLSLLIHCVQGGYIIILISYICLHYNDFQVCCYRGKLCISYL